MNKILIAVVYFTLFCGLDAMERKVSKGENEKTEFYSGEDGVALQDKTTKKIYAAKYVNGSLAQLPNEIDVFNKLKRQYEKQEQYEKSNQ